MRVLIVDDDELVVKLLGQVCRTAGHETRLCTSPERALETLFEHPIDLLITDLAMPVMDGVTLARQARRLQPSIFTLIITGHARDFALDDVIKEGQIDVMFKPFHMNELRARVALAEHHAEHQRAQRATLDVERQRLLAQSVERSRDPQGELVDRRRPKTS